MRLNALPKEAFTPVLLKQAWAGSRLCSCKARTQQDRGKRREEPVWSLVLNVGGIDSDTTGALLWSVVDLLFKNALCKKQKAQIVNFMSRLYSIQYTVYSIQYTVYSIQYTVYSIQYTVYSIQYTVYSIQYTVYSIQYTVYSIQYTVYSIQYTVYSIQYTVYSIHQYTVYIDIAR